MVCSTTFTTIISSTCTGQGFTGWRGCTNGCCWFCCRVLFKLFDRSNSGSSSICFRSNSGTKIATEELKGRICEFNLADLQNDEDQSFKKIKLCIEEVQGKNCLTDFHGLSL